MAFEVYSGRGAFAKFSQCCSVRVKCRDGFDETGDGEGVAHAAGAANQMDGSAFASELNGDTHQGGDSGTVDLRDAIQIDEDFAAAAVDHRSQSFVELFAGFTNGQAAADVQHVDALRFTDSNFHGDMFRHEQSLIASRA